METLTRSGCGRILDLEDRRPEAVATAVVAAAADAGTVLTRGLDLSRDDFRALAQAAGELSEHRFGSGSADLLDLNADPDPGKVVTGRAGLPLHADGALVGTRPGVILLYAAEYEEQPGFGRTLVCDQAAALASISDDLRETVLSVDWEYWVEDESHFPTIARRWISVPPVAADEGLDALSVALPFPPGSGNEGWRVRLAGRSVEESRAPLEAFNRHLESEAHCYRHAWRRGDLLAIDNRAVLHGREPISATGRRHLYRAQLQ
jgi:alpha-ketoglutarate-dependent taurine dioxygenase